MIPIKAISLFIFFVFIIPFTCFAGNFDGSKRLKGFVEKIIEINQFRISNDVDPNTVGLSQHFVIDFENMMVQPSKESLARRTSKIKNVVHIENKLILQGVEDGVENIDDGVGWSITISKKTGKVVLAASGDGVAYVAFGTCTVINNDQE